MKLLNELKEILVETMELKNENGCDFCVVAAT